VPSGRTAARSANRRGGKVRRGCRVWCRRSGKVRWRCRVWRSKMRRSSKMRCRCRVLRLRPKGWMCRHHQMPRGRRRLGDVRRNNGTPRHRPRELAHRCRSLFNRRPKRLTRPDSSEMAPGRCGFSQAPLAECGRLSVAGCWHRADTRPCCTRCGRRHCSYWPTGMGRYDSRSSEMGRTRCCCDCWMAVVLCQCHRWVLRCGLNMASLFSRCRNVAFPGDRELRWGWSRPHSPRAAVVADPSPVPVYDRLVIDVCY
jgi:hypothetical protein